jgi:hypothetical protein
MFEVLSTVIDDLDIPPTGPAIAELATLHHRLGLHLAQAAHKFNESGNWGIDGAISAKGWLSAHTDLGGLAASRLLRTGRTLSALPVTSEAALNGSLGSGQLDVILSSIGHSLVEKFAAFEAVLVPQLRSLDIAGTKQVIHHWKNVVTSDDEPPAEPPSALHVSNLPDGRYALNDTLSEEAGSVVTEALRHAASPDVDGEPERNPAQRRADALGDICQFYLDHHPTAGPSANRPSLVVTVDLEVLERRSSGVASRVNGQPLSQAVLDRITCDCDINRLITDGAGVILDYGRRTRVLSDPLRAVIAVRDGGCRFAGCGRPMSHCQVHHVVR